MNKAELVVAVSESTGFTRKDTEKFIKAFEDTIRNELSNGNKVQLVGFGTFEVSERKAREGRNPQTGAPMQIPASKIPRFRVGKSLKDAVN